VAGAGARRWAAEGRGVWARARERGGLGRKRPSRGGVSFSLFSFFSFFLFFYFLFPFSISYFYFFYLFFF
jgi:hypothetical protein